jgi:hypothetical protein
MRFHMQAVTSLKLSSGSDDTRHSVTADVVEG